MNVFGVKEFSSARSEEERAAEDIRIVGFTVLTDVLSPTELELARAKLDEIYALQVREIGGEERLAAINDAHTARAPLAYDELFLRIAVQPRVLAVVSRLLGDYYTLMLQNGVLNVPARGNEQNAGQWHRDLNYQHFVSSRPLSISALYCVDDFSPLTGGTHMLAATHKSEPFPTEEFVRRHETIVDAPAGSVLVFDSMLYHRGGVNRSDKPRRGINHMYTLPLLRQQISFPKLLGDRYRDNPFLRRFLGYDIEASPSVQAFREERLARLGTGAGRSS